LARRGLDLGYNKRVFLALGIFVTAVIVVVTGILHVSAAFSMAAVAMVLSGVLPVKEMYKSVDWPVIVLLGAMIPVGVAMETTGGAATIANAVLSSGAEMPPWAIIAVVLIVTMFLSDLINNAATVLLMAPIAIGLAKGLGFSVDPFLMAVAYGGSSAFLTPIGHQSNTLVMAPGGYRFTDYPRMGLPLEIILVLVGVPLILWFFPCRIPGGVLPEPGFYSAACFLPLKVLAPLCYTTIHSGKIMGDHGCSSRGRTVSGRLKPA
jgi:di/tricarboxylate transporter